MALRGAIAIFKRDFKKFLSNPFMLIMTLAMPIMYLLIFGSAIGGTITGIPIGVVQDSPYVTVTPLYTQAVTNLGLIHQSSQYADTFTVIPYTDAGTAKNALEKGKLYGVAVFPPASAPGDDVQLYLDSSEYTIPQVVQSGVTAAVAQTGTTSSVNVVNIYGKINYLEFFGIGIIVMAIFSSTMFGGGLAMIRDRENGIIEGYLVTPVKRSSIIIGTIGSGTVKAFFAGCVIFLVDIFVAGVIVRTPQDFFLALLVIFLTSIGVTSLVVSLASRFSNQQSYASVIAFMNLLMFMTSGVFYPVIGMPGWLRWITAVNPEYYAIHALRSVTLRNQGLDVIWFDLVAITIFSIAMVILGILTYRRTLE
ncbi:MAG TPA: ABC transporter permease [Methanoregulaceae archaeon]|nr:ABC transporter permease [Methanoregulaceae archaeon]